MTFGIEFTQLQRDVFCVFSGPGVHNLRNHLDGQIQIPNTNGDDDNVEGGEGGGQEYMYNEDDDEGEGEKYILQKIGTEIDVDVLNE